MKSDKKLEIFKKVVTNFSDFFSEILALGTINSIGNQS